jgi:hypothetical protein
METTQPTLNNTPRYSERPDNFTTSICKEATISVVTLILTQYLSCENWLDCAKDSFGKQRIEKEEIEHSDSLHKSNLRLFLPIP